MLAQPLGVRTLVDDRTLDLFVFDDATLLGIDQEHVPRLQTAFALNASWWQIEHTGFRCDHDHAIGRDVVTTRAQTVAIEYGTDTCAVSKSDGSRSVPRLH